MDTSAPAADLRCLVVDDQPVTLNQLVRMLRDDPSVTRICTAPDSAAALRLLQEVEVDVAFIEIRLPGMDGIELARVLRCFRTPPALVFVSRSAERAAEAFRLGAVAYLAKPPRPERLADSLRRVRAVRAVRAARAIGAAGGRAAINGAGWAGGATGGARVGAQPARPGNGRASAQPETGGVAVRVESGATTTLVCGSTVRWAQARGDYVRLHTADGSYLVRARLAALADDWQGLGVVRIHRSFLVQLSCVSDVRTAGSGRLTVVVDGHRLPVSRRRTEMVRSRLGHGR